MSKILAELLLGARPVWEAENEGAAGGTETQAAAAANDSQPGGAANETQAAGNGNDTQAAGTDEAKPALPEWASRRIATLTARNAQLNQKLNEKPAVTPASKPLDATADFEARVAAEATKTAEALVAVRTFNERCNAAVDKGRADYGAGEFNASISGLQQLVDSSDPASMANYQDFIESTLETGAGADLLYELGKDLNEAERILALPSKRRAIELARKADLVGKPAEPSNAAKPIRAIESHGARHEEIKASDADKADRLSTAEWMARRNAEVAAQSARR